MTSGQPRVDTKCQPERSGAAPSSCRCCQCPFVARSAEYVQSRGVRLAHARSRAVRRARSWRGIVPFTHLAPEGRMTVTIGRRELLAALGGAAAGWPLAARAQQTERMRRIGIIQPASSDDPEYQVRVGALLQELQQLGWIIGRNIRIDTRWTKGDADEARKYAAELVALAPDAIVATGVSTVGPLLQLTRTVPVVFPAASDPVAAGLVESLARPRGNATGFLSFEYSLSGKWPEL